VNLGITFTMLGKFKRNVLKVGQGEGKTVDNLFETAKNKWEEFVAQVDIVKGRVDGLVKHSIGLCETGEQVIETISGSFPESSNFLHLESVNVAHKALATKDKEEIDALAVSLNSKISELKNIFSTLKVAIVERETLRSQMDYYKTKVGGLHAERDKLKDKGGEQQKQLDRRLRNEANLNRLTHQYELKNKELKHELYTLEAVRLNVLAYLYLDVVHLEHLLAQGLTSATNPGEAELPTPFQQQSDHFPSESDPYSSNQQEHHRSKQNSMPFDEKQAEASFKTASTAIVMNSPSFDSEALLPTSFSFDNQQPVNGTTSTVGPAGEKKRPPPFIRSRVASSASSPSSSSFSSTSSLPSVSSSSPFSDTNGIQGTISPTLTTQDGESNAIGSTGAQQPVVQISIPPSIPPPMPKSLPPVLKLSS